MRACDGVAMVMSIMMTPPPLIFLLMIHGVYSADDGWSVIYNYLHICALKDSTVTIQCTYSYPTGHHITEVFWTNTDSRDPPDLSEDSEHKQRIQYVGDKQHDCSVKLTDVRHTDSHKYYFRFITDKDKWIGAPGVTLAVTDKPVISISSSGVIVEGDSVTLTCSSESNPPVHIYSWFKENQTSSVGSGNVYYISNIRSDHSGQYKCKTRHTCGEKYSDPVTLNVLYPPRNVSASISSSGVIVEGDSVTLTCSSESNPPVHIYSWFKEETSVGSGNIYSISNIRSDHSGQYKCKTGHTCGEKYSDPVTLNVLYPPRNVSASISSSGVIVEGDSVTLTCSSESNPPVHIYSWFKEETSVGSGNIYSISNIRSDHSGQYKCKAENELGQKYSALTLNVLYPPRNVSASISSSGVIVEGDSVNLTCSSESNPPVHIYSWFKENQTSSVGSGQTFSITNINSRLSGWIYCVAQNEVGSQRSAAVSLTVKGQASGWFSVVLFAVITCGCAVCVFIVFMRRRKRDDRIGLKQVPRHCSSETQHDDVQYAGVTPRHLREDQTSPESRDPEEVQYTTVHSHRNTDVRRSDETENHYDNITNHQHDAAVRSAVEIMEDKSVIYSSLR